MIPNKEQLKKLIKNSKKVLDQEFKDLELELDHAAYITKNKNEYENVKEEIGDNLSLRGEFLRSGRLISIYELEERIEESGISLTKIVLLEPKPKLDVDKAKWEHISFIVDDLEKLIEDKKGTEQELKKIRQIENDRFAYYLKDDFEIQFRNNKFEPKESEEKWENPKQNKEELKNLKEDYKKLYEVEKDKRLRLLADMENEKKRLEKHKEEFVKMANSALINDLFEVIDDINRARLNNKDDESLNMIYNKILGIMNNYGVIPLDVKPGAKFEPEHMEAISTIQNAKMDGKVIHVEQLGFKTKEDDKIIRNCRVIVGKK